MPNERAKEPLSDRIHKTAVIGIAIGVTWLRLALPVCIITIMGTLRKEIINSTNRICLHIPTTMGLDSAVKVQMRSRFDEGPIEVKIVEPIERTVFGKSSVRVKADR